MRVLITGASGFVGRHVIRRLLAEGEEVSATHWEDAPAISGVELHEVDVLDGEALARVVERARPQGVIHLAGLSHVGESWTRMDDYFRVNVLGTENVLRAARGARVVLASSAEVYGAVPEAEQPIGEDRPLAPGSPYALSKAAAERLAVALGDGDALIVRSFNLVGAGQALRFALPSFASQLAAIRDGRAEPVIRVGNLSARRDFVHVEAAAEAYALLLRRGEGGTVYNLASGRALSMAEALERLLSISGVEACIQPDPERMRPVDQPLLVGDPARLEALGWRPEPGFDRAIEDLWEESGAAARV